MAGHTTGTSSEAGPAVDPQEGLSRLLRDLRTRAAGSPTARPRRLEIAGPHELSRHQTRTWPARWSVRRRARPTT